MPRPSKPTTVIYASTEEKTIGAGSTVSIAFTNAGFTKAPSLAVTAVIGKGPDAGYMSWITVSDVSTAGATLTVKRPISTGVANNLDVGTTVQVAFTAVQL
jgi:hypothetical protein